MARFRHAAGDGHGHPPETAMTSDDEDAPTAYDAVVQSHPARAVEPASPDTPWLLRHKVELPDPIEGYVRRPDVEAPVRADRPPSDGAARPRGLRQDGPARLLLWGAADRGLAVAWLSLDEDDGPGSVATHLALAFERAGLETFDPAGERDGGARAQAPDPEADSQAQYRINLLMRALERHGAPCVLALDEVERLRSPEAAALISTLLRRAPRNLHVGMAFRVRPPGLDIAMFALEGRAATVTAEELRFSKSEISRFFDRRLSRQELAAVAADSAGWPLALHLYRNAPPHGTPNAGGGGDDDTVAGWIEMRLWRGLSAGDRDFVLDIALFDGLDPDLIDEVTGAPNSRRRIASMRALAGLLSTTGGGGSTMRLHPLIKSYCERRFEEAPERFRALHRGIAGGLARRGRVVEALRHAAEAGDTALLGRVAESTGGVRLWLEQGLEVLCTVDGALTPEVLSKYPRLALVRCVALTVSGDITGAKRLYGAAAEETAGFTRDHGGGDDRALQIDHIFVQGLLHMCGCSPYGAGIMAAVADAEAVANAADTDPLLRGMFSLGMCIAHNQTTAFDAAVEWASRARAALGRASPYLAHVDFQAGSVAMARGRTQEARSCYDRALRVARASHLRDAGAVMIGEALAAEFELERSAGAPRRGGPRVSPRLLGECSAWLDIYAASIGVGAELALWRGGPEAALSFVDDAREYARRTERPALARFLSALQVSVLLAGDDVDEAVRAWRFDRLPERAAECIDLETQSWREVEMLACARLRLLIALSEYDAGRELAAALEAVAAERTLVRTRMRGLALSMVLEHRAGAADRARARLADYLRLFAAPDYARPLARDRAIALAVLDDVADAPATDAAVGAVAADAARHPARRRERRDERAGPDAERSRDGRARASGEPNRQGDRRGPEAVPRRRALRRAQHLREARSAREARCGASRPGTGHPPCGRGTGDRFVARGNLRRQGGLQPGDRPVSWAFDP